MKKYLIFDLDGTLLESSADLIDFIVNLLAEKYEFSKEEFLYLLASNRGTALKTQLQVFFNIEGDELEKLTNEVYEKIREKNDFRFFPGVPEKIVELGKKYTLFLSTGNSTKFAKENLEKAGIQNCFLKILGSEQVYKGTEHIDIFKDLVDDEDFERKSIFIGDGQKDREIAKNHNMDFIHIDKNLENTYNDTYEIKSVSEIDKVLEKFNI